MSGIGQEAGPEAKVAHGQATDLVDAAAAAMRAGEPIVIHDDRLCVVAVAAEAVDAETIADFARSARGVIGVAMASDRIDALGIPRMERSTESKMPEYGLSVDAVVGTTTGISAADRAATVAALLAEKPDGRLAIPGHILPIRAAAGGILERAGIAEAAVAIAELAGLQPVVATCGILLEDGSALRPEALAGHPRFSSLVAISPLLVRAHRRGLPLLASPDPGGFREAMSLLVGGVAAVTTRDAVGVPRGMLATSVTSYTDSPPSLLISVAHASRTHEPLLAAVGIGVHLLAHGQSDVAGVMASKADDKFAALAWDWDGDVPRIDGSLAYMRCLRAECFALYDHTILVADVETTLLDDAFPLVYFQRTLGWQLSHSAP